MLGGLSMVTHEAHEGQEAIGGIVEVHVLRDLLSKISGADDVGSMM
jgi:hypothetical protein